MKSIVLGGVSCEVEIDVDGLVPSADLDPSYGIVLGMTVKLNPEAVARLCTPPTVHALAHQQGLVGIVRAYLYRPSGCPTMVRVDFGDAGTWSGPITMLARTYADA